MSGLVRKLVIFAAIDGLVIQPHSPWDQPAALCIEYKTNKITPTSAAPSQTYKKKPYIESHGIIGLLKITSFSFLVSIAKRDQVAQIFGKPIYCISDVVLLPLSSQQEAEKAIAEAHTASQKSDPTVESDSSSSATDSENDENLEKNTEPHMPVTPTEARPSSEETRPGSERSKSSTSIVEDVITRKGQYGSFASQWFSRRGWGLERKAEQAEQANGTAGENPKPVEEPESIPSEPPVDPKEQDKSETETVTETLANHEESAQVTAPSDPTLALLPKILRSTKMILSSRSFYFSYEYDITRRIGDPGFSHKKPMATEDVESMFFWNRHLGLPFSTAGYSKFVMPIMQGFVGQHAFAVQHASAKAVESSEVVSEATSVEVPSEEPPNSANPAQSFLLTLISRRSTKRNGLRYLRRGIDDAGNCANMVETEQILSSPTWDLQTKLRSFVQVRGSIPLYFSQSPFSFKPVPVLHQTPSVNDAAFTRHFKSLKQRYNSIQIAVLVDKHGVEVKIGEEYEEATKRSNEGPDSQDLRFEWFDFHAECRGFKFQNVSRLVKKLEGNLESFGETIFENEATQQQQTGIVRTNCMDCLDRTNVAQCAFGQFMLQKDIEHEGYAVDFEHDEGTQWFNVLWADNGDAISRQYASTAALKGDFTRTRKRNYRGALNDLGLTLSRYYNNIVNDYFSQAVIDVLLGNVSTKVFEEFESSMMSADPGISIDKVRESAIETCSKLVIQDSEEVLKHGWTVLSPAVPNTLRALPFEESVLLLTDAAVYGCKFDWNTQKVMSFERIDLRCVKKLRLGTYITSTLTDRQIDETQNVGVVIEYTPGKENVMRVNTRSLQSSTDPDKSKSKEDEDKHGSGIMSWLSTRSTISSRIMAVKVISTDSAAADAKSVQPPIVLAEAICKDIQTAVKGDSSQDEVDGVEIIEKAEIISVAEAYKRTGYLEQLGHSIKKLVWV